MHVVGIAVGNVGTAAIQSGVTLSDVPLDGAIRIRFDRFLEPWTAVRQSLRVTAGMVIPDGGALPAGEEFEQPFYDAIERVVVFRHQGPWIQGNRYTVTIWSPDEEPNGNGFRAFDGAPLAKSISFAFTTSDKSAQSSEKPFVPVAYCDVCYAANGQPTSTPDPTNVFVPGGAKTLRNSCGFGACHAPNPAGIPQGVDLSSKAGLHTTAIGVPAHQTETGPSSREALHTPAILGRQMPLIDPGHPGNSYVLYKILVNPNAWHEAPTLACTTNADCPATTWCLPDATGATSCTGLQGDEMVPGAVLPSAVEIHRLERYVMGAPMPYTVDDNGAPKGNDMSLEAVRAIQAWIAGGAPIVDDATCPKDPTGQPWTQRTCAPKPM